MNYIRNSGMYSDLPLCCINFTCLVKMFHTWTNFNRPNTEQYIHNYPFKNIFIIISNVYSICIWSLHLLTPSERHDVTPSSRLFNHICRPTTALLFLTSTCTGNSHEMLQWRIMQSLCYVQATFHTNTLMCNRQAQVSLVLYRRGNNLLYMAKFTTTSATYLY